VILYLDNQNSFRKLKPGLVRRINRLELMSFNVSLAIPLKTIKEVLKLLDRQLYFGSRSTSTKVGACNGA